MGYLVTTNAIGQIYDGPSTGMCAPYLFPSALHDFHGNGVDLVMHFHRPLFPATDLYQQDTEICSSEIQGQEVTMLCHKVKHRESHRWLCASWWLLPRSPQLPPSCISRAVMNVPWDIQHKLKGELDFE